MPELKSPFDKVPNELLLRILRFSAYSHDGITNPCGCLRSSDIATVKELTLVCRRFNCMAKPLLWETVTVSLQPVEDTDMRWIYMSGEAISYQQYVRAVTIRPLDLPHQLAPSVCEAAILAAEFVAECRGIKCLSICGFENELLARFIPSSVTGPPAIEHLSIAPVMWSSLSISRILTQVGGPSLRALYIEGGELYDRYAYTDIEDEEVEPIPRDDGLYIHLPLLTTLSLKRWRGDRKTISLLIGRSTGLQHFRFSIFSSNRECKLDLEFFHDCLWPHRHSLRSIRIGDINPSGDQPVEGGRPLDVSEFTSLTSLTMSRHFFQSNPVFSPGLDGDCLLAPNLETFSWTVNEGHEDERIYIWRRAEKQWLRDLADEAQRRLSPVLVGVQIGPSLGGFDLPMELWGEDSGWDETPSSPPSSVSITETE